MPNTSSGVSLYGIGYPIRYTSIDATAFKQMTPSMIWLNSRIVYPNLVPNPCSQHLPDLFDMTVPESGLPHLAGIVEHGLIPHLLRYPRKALLNKMRMKGHNARLT
jgi:hypothetical protein